MIKSMIFISSIIIIIFHIITSNITLIEATILQPLIDVKGNDAIRQIRFLYDLHYNSQQTLMMRKKFRHFNHFYLNPNNNKLIHNNNGHNNKSSNTLMYAPWTMDQRLMLIKNRRHYNNNYQRYIDSRRSEDATLNIIELERGRPLFAEMDFIPRYIPESTSHIAISVTLPAHIRGRQWILGYHREQFTEPICRLCTNLDKSYTIPVTIFLPDDGWCWQGRVQTIWKIEALKLNNNPNKNIQLSFNEITPLQQQHQQQEPTDQTDMILAYGYDQLKQISIKNNNSNMSSKCHNNHTNDTMISR